MGAEVMDLREKPLFSHSPKHIKSLTTFLTLFLIPIDKCISHPSSRKLLFKAEATITEIHNWSKCRKQLTARRPALVQVSTAQPKHLRLREPQGVPGRKIIRPRAPRVICWYRENVFYLWQGSYAHEFTRLWLSEQNQISGHTS